MEKTKQTIWTIAARLVGTIVFIALFCWLCLHIWAVVNRKGIVTAVINDPHFELYVFSIGGGLLGLVALVLAFIWAARRDVKLISLAAAILFLLPLGWVKTKEWFKTGRFETIAMPTDLTVFRPFVEKNILVKLDKPLEKRLEGRQPRIDGVLPLFRYYASIVENIGRKDGWMAETEDSGTVFNRLLMNEADMAFNVKPSQAILDKAVAKGKRLETTPVVKDAFVFYVHAGNPVDNLSLEQLKQIYSGAITDWKDAGSQKSGVIEAFQRLPKSSEQAVFRQITGNSPLMEPPTMVQHTSGGIVNIPVDYRNSPNAIGYSYRSQAADLLLKKKIKLLSIDGMAPTPENILSGSYPYAAEYEMIMVKEDGQPEELEQNIRKLREFIFSPQGREIAEKCGLVPMDDVKQP